MHRGVSHTTLFRMIVAGILGVVVAVAAGTLTHTTAGALIGWIAAGASFCLWTWLVVGRLSPERTKTHALREDPGRAVGDLVLLIASLGGVVAVGVLLVASRGKQGQDAAAIVGILSVATSWCVVNTLYMLRYAREYFGTRPGGVDFNSDDDPDDDSPDYGDFAYLAFTIGMTYQVSDTTFTNKLMRHTALRHALLSFVLGAIVIASTINLVSQLASSG